MPFTYHSLGYDKRNNTYYVVGEIHLLEIQINSKSMALYGQPRAGAYPCTIFIDKQLHIIGGDSNKRHIIFNADSKEF